MYRFLPVKKIKLGRWDTEKGTREIMRVLDLANYDSCGTCSIPEYPKLEATPSDSKHTTDPVKSHQIDRPSSYGL